MFNICFSVVTIFVQRCLLSEESRVSVRNESCYVVEEPDERSCTYQEGNGG